MAAKDLDRVVAMRAFAAVGRRLSFVEAAAELEISASALSRRVTMLEQALGCRLLQRTTRRVALTEAGALYLERCGDVLARLEEADAEASSHAGEPRGALRIALPGLYGQKVIAPLLPAFMERCPELRLELSFDDRFVDLVAGRFDAGVRIGDLAAGDYVARKLARNPRYLCASPEYLERCGAPASAGDLARRDCLHFSPLADGAVWRLARGGRTVEIAIDPALRADNAEALRCAALGGRGIAMLARFVVGEDLASGRLVEVLPDWSVADSWIYAIYPNARFLPMKTRAFVDFLAERVGGRAD